MTYKHLRKQALKRMDWNEETFVFYAREGMNQLFRDWQLALEQQMTLDGRGVLKLVMDPDLIVDEGL